MKTPALSLAAGLLLLCGCQKTIDPVSETTADPAIRVAASAGFTKYTIAKGEHVADHSTFKVLDASAIDFIVRFDSTAIYQSLTAENQYDINKLYGFSDNNAHHHSFSARF